MGAQGLQSGFTNANQFVQNSTDTGFLNSLIGSFNDLQNPTGDPAGIFGSITSSFSEQGFDTTGFSDAFDGTIAGSSPGGFAASFSQSATNQLLSLGEGGAPEVGGDPGIPGAESGSETANQFSRRRALPRATVLGRR